MALKITSMIFLIAAFVTGFTDSFRPDYTYIYSTHSYYKFHKTDATWSNARATCQSEGSMLFHPESEQELRQVLSVLGVGNNGNMYLFVGLSDLAKRGSYETVDGRPISQVHNKWGSDEPNSCPECRCARMDVDSYIMFAKSCVETRHFICKQLQQPVDHAMTAAALEIKTIIANTSDKQTAILERLAETAANQATALERLTVNLTSTMERQALALEKLVIVLEESNQIDVRSGQ